MPLHSPARSLGQLEAVLLERRVPRTFEPDEFIMTPGVLQGRYRFGSWQNWQVRAFCIECAKDQR
jgi:hypothetical protein